MNRPWSLNLFDGCSRVSRAHAAGRLPALSRLGAVALWFVLGGAAAWGQPPQPFVPETAERSGLLMRFAGDSRIPSARPLS